MRPQARGPWAQEPWALGPALGPVLGPRPWALGSVGEGTVEFVTIERIKLSPLKIIFRRFITGWFHYGIVFDRFPFLHCGV